MSPLKSLKFAPPKVIKLIFRTVPPALLNVTVCAGVVVPIGSAGKFREPGENVSTGPAGLTPVPARLTDCGLLGSLSVIMRFALRLPAAVGLNVTSMLQELPAETFKPLMQVEVPAIAKSPAFAPVMAGIAVIVSGDVDLFSTVAVCALPIVPTAPEKLSAVGEIVATGLAGLTAVPARFTDCGLLASLSVIASVALRLPVAVALNVTSMLQELPEATVAPFVQVVLPAIAKSPAFAPLIAGAAVMFSDELDLF
jgi:hypothetical protein